MAANHGGISSVLPSQPITPCECEECRDVRAHLGHLRWNEVLPPAIEEHFGSLPLLTDEAFQALLPAFLIGALGEMNGENRTLEWTLYALCGAYEEDRATAEDAEARVRHRIARFTEAQRAAVRAFLGMAAAEPELEFHREPIARALSAIWI